MPRRPSGGGQSRIEDHVVAARAQWVTVGVAGLVALSACTGGSEATPSPTPSSASPTASAGSDEALAAFYAQDVRWERCGGDFDCTTVEVPLDYSDPTGESIDLDVVRLRAKDPQGSLVLNPGGPGGSGVEYARAARFVLTRDLVAAYDIVGFDPRGVVGSDPVDCVSDEVLYALYAADGTPDDAGEVADLERLSAEFGEGCAARSPDIAGHMDTESAARDMDILRAVLGDEKLNYLGKSYGTFLGATYAELFPERVGRVVLDGVLPSQLDADQVTLGQAKAFDLVLRRFVADCLTQDDCPLQGDVEQGVAQIRGFIADLDQDPLPGVGRRKLNEALATYAILSYLYFPPTDWEVLRFGLDVAFDGDGSVLMDMMDERIQRNSDGSFSDNGNEAFYAVSCLDRPAVGDADHAARLQTQWATEAPVFGPYLAWGNLPCWEWPFGPGTAQAAGDLPVYRAVGSDPILVVSTRYDPATPYEWGVQVADELDNARLLTYDGDGHTAYKSGSSCVDQAVDQYFIDGTLPDEGTECPAGG